MKKIFILILSVAILTFSLNSFAKGQGKIFYKQNKLTQLPALISSLPYENLNKTEKESMIFMLEEEKLARDVYLSLAQKWNLRVFSNIARAEQTHMDTIKTLLKKYNIDNAVINDIGEFNNKELQSLFNELVKKGSQSINDALIVGATIEDLDIKDLESYLKNIDNQDITLAYKNLIKGSRNHLRAFVNNLKRNGEDYSPQYISQKEFNRIITTPHERGIIR